jgi:hypothetical protein
MSEAEVRPDACSQAGAVEVSIITATRNRRAWLEQTIASVRRQSHRAWELIVVDDASSDDTAAWLAGLADPRIRSIRFDTRRERAQARNAGRGAARGEFLLFLDDDDLLPPTALANHLAALRRHPDAVASIGGYEIFEAQGPRRACPIVSRPRVQSIWSELLYGWMAVSGQCLIRASALPEREPWSSQFIPIEDHQLWLELARRGPVVLLSAITLEYRKHSGQWRPANLLPMMTEVRRQAIAGLTGRPRRAAEALLRSRGLGAKLLRRGRHARAALLLLRAPLAAPALLRSPLARPRLISPLLRSLGGSWGAALARLLFPHALGRVAWRSALRSGRPEEFDGDGREAGAASLPPAARAAGDS